MPGAPLQRGRRPSASTDGLRGVQPRARRRAWGVGRTTGCTRRTAHAQPTRAVALGTKRRLWSGASGDWSGASRVLSVRSRENQLVTTLMRFNRATISSPTPHLQGCQPAPRRQQLRRTRLGQRQQLLPGPHRRLPAHPQVLVRGPQRRALPPHPPLAPAQRRAHVPRLRPQRRRLCRLRGPGPCASGPRRGVTASRGVAARPDAGHKSGQQGRVAACHGASWCVTACRRLSPGRGGGCTARAP
jgi:hypothetical protein